MVITILILKDNMPDFNNFVYLKFYLVILLYLILIIPIIFLFCFVTSKLFALIFITFFSLLLTSLYWIIPLIPNTSNSNPVFLNKEQPTGFRYSNNSTSNLMLDLSYLNINNFLVSKNKYYINLLESLEENNLNKNIKAFYQLSSFAVGSLLINDKNIIDKLTKNVKNKLEYSQENKIYNFMCYEYDSQKCYYLALKFNVNPPDRYLLPLFRNGYIENKNKHNSKTYLKVLLEELINIFKDTNEFSKLTNFLQKGTNIDIRFLEIFNLIENQNISFFEYYFNYLIINYPTFFKNIIEIINDINFEQNLAILETIIKKRLGLNISWTNIDIPKNNNVVKFFQNSFFVNHLHLTFKQLIDPYTIWMFGLQAYPDQRYFYVHKANEYYYEYNFKTMAPNNKRSLIGTLTTLFIADAFATWLLCYLFNRYKFMDRS